MSVQLAPSPVFQGLGFGGLPLPGGKLFTYVAGTTTPQATYIDSTQTTQNTNPVILNANGQANVWLDTSLTYKLKLTDFFGNQIWVVDNIPGGQFANGVGISLIPTPTNTLTLGNATNSWKNIYLGPNNAPALDTLTGNILYYARTSVEIAASVVPTDFGYPPGNVLRYGADPTGVADSTTPIQNALNLNLNGGCAYEVIIPPGIYLTTGLTISLANTYVTGFTPSQNSLSACTILKGTGANTTVLTVISFVVGGLIKGLYFDRSVTATGGAGLYVQDEVTIDIENCKSVNQFYGFLLGATNFARIYNSQAEQNFGPGFLITQNTVTITPLQWIVDTCLSQVNNGQGFSVQAIHDNGSGHGTVDPRFNACGTFANASSGWLFTGAVAHNDLTCVDCYSSFDGAAGWSFENTGSSIELIGCFAEGAGLQATGRSLGTPASHVGAGILFETSGDTAGFVSLVGFIARQNSFQGIAVSSNAVFSKMSLVNCQCIDNGQFGNKFGIDLEEPNTIFLLSSCSSNNLDTSNQNYGISAANASHVYLSACDFSNNATAPSFASSGTYNAAVTNGVAPFQSPALLTGVGTPTSPSIVSNFSGTAATNAQMQAAIAQIITTLKQVGIYGA